MVTAELACEHLVLSTRHSASERSCWNEELQGLAGLAQAHSLTLAAYGTTSTFPRQEVCGLAIQIRRCVAQVAANIAEGFGKSGNGEFLPFLKIAPGSTSELEYHFLLAHGIEFLGEGDYEDLNHRVIESKGMACVFWCAKSRDRSPRGLIASNANPRPSR